MRIFRYITLLFISLFVSPIFISQVVANDHGPIIDELTSQKIIDDGSIFSPNNLLPSYYYCWRNLVANERVAYRSNSHGFEILNISNPETIEVINEFHLEENLTSSFLTLNDTFLYLSVADYNNWSLGFYVFDVVNHENTSISKYFLNTSLTDFYCYGLYTKGSFLYYLVNNINDIIGGVIVIDCSNVTHPVEMGSYFHSGCCFQELVFYNNFAYLIGNDYCEFAEADIQIINISNASSLTKVGEVVDNDTFNGLVCYEDYLLLAGMFGGLHIYELTDPINPQKISTYTETDVYFKDVCISENIAFLVKTKGCSVLDLSDIHSPKRIGNFKYKKENGGFEYGLVEDDLLYLHKNSEDLDRMLFILDVSNPKRPTMLFPSWMAPRWVRYEITLFLVSVVTPIIGISIIAVIIVIVIRKRKRKP